MNHKTGTFLARCIRTQMQQCKLSVETLTYHTRGGFSSDALQVNMIRDPFNLVASAYDYHIKALEKWTTVPFASNKRLTTITQGWSRSRRKKNTSEGRSAMAAFCSYTQGCFGDNFGHFPNTAMAYAEALRQMNHTEGLLFESLRAMEIQVPFVLSSSKSCWQANVAAAHEGRPGRCVNVLLDDDTMVDLAAALKSLRGKCQNLI